MKVEVRNIKFYLEISEDSLAFAGNLYIDGKAVGICRNTGRGADTLIIGSSAEDWKAIRSANEFYGSLPARERKVFGIKIMSAPTLQEEIADQVGRFYKEEAFKVFIGQNRELLDRKSDTTVIYLTAGGIERYEVSGGRLSELLVTEKGREEVLRVLKNVIAPEMSEPKLIYNRILPLELLERAGLRKVEYSESVSMKKGQARSM